MADTITVQIPSKIYVNFSLDKCQISKYNGEYENIEVDLSNLDGTDITTLAERSIKIALQSVRNFKNEAKYNFLTAKAVTFPKPGTRVATDPTARAEKAKSILDTLPPEELAKILARYNLQPKAAILTPDQLADEIKLEQGEDHDSSEETEDN